MMSKRIISLFTALTVLISVCVFGTSAYADIGIEHESQVSKLNAFGILTGYPDPAYKADAQVTAKDFVIAAYKLRGMDGDFTESAAAKFGFKADDKSITVQAAAAVLLNVFDYGYEADTYGGYPDGYMRTASKYGLMSGIGLSSNDKLTNDAMAMMLYNALSMKIPMVDYSSGHAIAWLGSETVMDNLEIYRGRGIVTGTCNAALNGCTAAHVGEIIIDNTDRYLLGKTYGDTLFGYSVEFYYNKDKELLWIDAANEMNVTKIAEVDIIGFTASSINYSTDNGKSRDYVIEENASFVYNGKAVDISSFSGFVPISGYIILLDNDNDNKAEVVCSEAYEYYLASAKNASSLTVNDYETGRQIVLDPNIYDSFKIVKNGVRASFDDINVNDVLAITRSDSEGGLITVTVCSKAPVSGTVTFRSSDSIKVDDAEFGISTAYEGADIEINKSGTFYFDLNGNIVRFTQGQNATSKYAYLIAAELVNMSQMRVKLLTVGGTVEDYCTRRKVNFNGTSVVSDDLYKYLLNGTEIERQLVEYSLNSDGLVNMINTADKSNLYSGSDEEIIGFSNDFQGHGRYRKNNLSFNSKYLITAETPIFVVPASREYEDYNVQYATSLTNGTSYYISLYDVDEYMTAGAVVLDEIASDPEQLKSKRCVVVDKVSTGINEDYENIVFVDGYQQGSKITFKTKDAASLKDSEGGYYSLGEVPGYTQVSMGDIIQVSQDADGNLIAFRTLYKADESKKKLVVASNETPNEFEEGGNINEFSDMFVLSGTVKARSASVLVVQSDTKRAHKITNGANVYIVGKTITKGTTDDIGIGDQVYVHTYQGNLQEVVIYR